jgi:hypothetical protein
VLSDLVHLARTGSQQSADHREPADAGRQYPAAPAIASTAATGQVPARRPRPSRI